MSFLMLQINQSLEKGNRNERKMMTYISLLVINNIWLHTPEIWDIRGGVHMYRLISGEEWFVSDVSW